MVLRKIFPKSTPKATEADDGRIALWNAFNDASASPQAKESALLVYFKKKGLNAPDHLRFVIAALETGEDFDVKSFESAGIIQRPESIKEGPAIIAYHAIIVPPKAAPL